MIDIKEVQAEALFAKVIQGLHNNEDAQLVSITKKIQTIDALDFYRRARYMGRNRTFWTNSNRSLFLVGIGEAYEIIADQSRFKETKQQWDNLLKQATIHNPYQLPGTGVIALGGMSFDPKKETTELWKHFKPSQFTIPEFQLTNYQGESYYTINVFVKKNDHPSQLAATIRQIEQTLFQASQVEAESFSIEKKVEIDPEGWKESVRVATSEIRNKKAEKIVLAREVRLSFDKQPESSVIIDKLLDTQANSYIFAFEKNSHCFIGATPERLVKVEQDRLLSTCLAGTAPRGKTKAEDERISYGLLHDQKNRQEHDFVVQMIKLAIKDYCTDLVIPGEPIVYPLKNLQHLYTPVTAKLKAGHSIFDIIEQLHPTPAVGGTPRDESLAFIRENELLDRGWYGAPIGWLDSNQNGEFAVAIRSGLIHGDMASLFAGCGVVKDSNPEAEYEETNIKLMPMLSVLGG
ncbi:isochorismate synthase [Oceanobacillus zhaokaii]|uniref:Isochorismate synthase MenF n=1 Tax=Oceanobacillus zhaokaii TaxID=2052660 RepID=A0A345PIK5_9BACI|nr:isochorismate synthase [Oceanobacillus zhaokaii]AXI09835.1 isochorismate synthase [Oceanobacillus zhaokaii]